MEVTKSNFNELLPNIESAINNSTFLSVDCELTGLNAASNINSFDTPKQYYEKVRTNCQDFLVIQYGISTFRYDVEKDKFYQQSYNFYIFRRPIDRNIPDQRFLCQTSSIDFLISQGFDFNKLFKEGLTYLNIEEENNYKKNLEEKQKTRANQRQNNNSDNKNIPIPETAQPFIDSVMEKIENFIESDETEVALPKCNSFIRRLIYQTVGESYSNKVSLETRQSENKDRILYLIRPKTLKEKEESDQKNYEEELNLLEDFIGFTKVLRIIVDSGKLVVGHNFCLDMLHTIDKFLTPLPADYEEFKECAHSLFPKILDTKFMSSMDPFSDLIQSNVLKPLLETVCQKPFDMPSVEIEENGQGYHINDNKEHEAGYDAYITGLSFLGMWKYLGRNKPSNDKIFKDYSLVNKYMNKIFLMKLVDGQHINLAGEDPNPSRDHVFYVTFPKEWKLNNIIQLFSPFGNVHVAWLDERSAYVALYKRDQAAVALSTLSQNDICSITTYSKRQAFLAGIKTPLPSPRVRKNRSSDSTQVAKKRRTDSFESSGSFSKWSIGPIMEEDQDKETTNEEDTVKKGAKRKASKTFEEDNAW